MEDLPKLADYGWMGIILAALLIFNLWLFKTLLDTIKAKDKEIIRVNELRALTGELVAKAITVNENAMVEFRKVIAEHTDTIKDLKHKLGEP